MVTVMVMVTVLVMVMMVMFAEDSPDVALIFTASSPASVPGLAAVHGLGAVLYDTVFAPVEGYQTFTITPMGEHTVSQPTAGRRGALPAAPCGSLLCGQGLSPASPLTPHPLPLTGPGPCLPTRLDASPQPQGGTAGRRTGAGGQNCDL